MAHPYWPLFDVEVRTPRVTLRYVDDELGVRLAAVAARGVHEPGWMPFSIPWTAAPSPDLERNTLKYYWRCRAETSVESWNIPLAVLVDDEVVGGSGIGTDRFRILRQFETGSWLGREFQGQGIGKELRVATLTLGFVGFGAEFTTTAAWQDNGPSLGVTKSLGYDQVGTRRTVRQTDPEGPDTLVTFEMSRAHFVEHVQRDDISLHGIDEARSVLGID